MNTGGTLVSAAQLAGELRGDDPPTLLDVRWKLSGPAGRELYEEGHIPGAAFVDLDAELSAPPGPDGRHPLPDPATFAAAMRRAGVSSGRPVVVYDADDSTGAARGWWVLRHNGHPSVRVLDGGLRAWTEMGGAVEAGTPEIAPGDFEPVPGPGAMHELDAEGAHRLARSGVLVDARAEERYTGEVEPIDPVGGHIPGALNAPATANLDPRTARFLPAARLADRFAALGATPGIAVGTYCGSGVFASQEVLALALAGIDAALYVGSWSNWTADPSRPIATGAAPG